MTASRRWTAAQAGANLRRPVPAATFRYYVSRCGAPKPIEGERDPVTGGKMYDADAVTAWDERRPGRGARTDLTREK